MERLLFLAHAFTGGSGEFPWVDCFLYNLCNAVEHMWLLGDDYSSRPKKGLLYPEKGKITGKLEMPLSVIPRLPKNASCDICGTKKFPKHQTKLWPLVYAWSRNVCCFPRKIVRVHSPREKWPQGDVMLTRRSVGIVCKEECVIKCEGLMYPGIETGVVKYVKKLAGGGLHNLARFVHYHFIQQEEKSGAVSYQLEGFEIEPTAMIYDDFDFVDRRFLTKDTQDVFSAEQVEGSVGGAKASDETGASVSLSLEKNLLTKTLRDWRSEVVSKKPGAPLFETDNFEPVGTLELIMGNSDKMLSPSFLIGLNKSPEKGQGSACKEVRYFLQSFLLLPIKPHYYYCRTTSGNICPEPCPSTSSTR